MKWSKLMAGILTGALLVTSVSPTFAAQEVAVEAEEAVGDEDGLVAYYDFETEGELNGATAIVKGLSAYTGDLIYSDNGKEGKALNLNGEYGLKLNHQDLGTDFTVSVWIYATSTLASNTCGGLFLGYHSPENWMSLAGDSGTTTKLWANGGNYSWTSLAAPTLTTDEWHNLIIIGTDGAVRAFYDGVKIVDSSYSNNPLSGSNQDIYLGVNYWDPCFPGMIDEVKVYNRAVSTLEALQLYDPTIDPEAILEEEGFTATGILSIAEGASKSVTVTLSDAVEAGEPTIVYESADTSIATVNENGLVTAVSGGQTTVTTTVTLGDVSLSQETIVVVTSDSSDYTEEELNPFAYITEPETRMSATVGDTVSLLTIPDSVKDYVTVEYYSSDDSALSYADGVVTVLAGGKTSVTAIVTAKYDGYMMEYSTAFNVPVPATPTPTPSPNPTDTSTPTTPAGHVSHVGKTFTVNGLKYKVTKDTDSVKEVRVTSMTKKQTTLKIPATVKNSGWGETFKVTSIKAKAFKGTAITKVTIGKNVTTIGPNAFIGCKKLKTVTIGKNVKTIGIRAFYGCSKLTKVTIKSTVLSSVKKNAFKKISKKAVIKVPSAKKRAYTKKLKGKIAKGVTIK